MEKQRINFYLSIATFILLIFNTFIGFKPAYNWIYDYINNSKPIDIFYYSNYGKEVFGNPELKIINKLKNNKIRVIKLDCFLKNNTIEYPFYTDSRIGRIIMEPESDHIFYPISKRDDSNLLTKDGKDDLKVEVSLTIEKNNRNWEKYTLHYEKENYKEDGEMNLIRTVKYLNK